MASFDPDADDPGLRLAAAGFVVKFWDRRGLAATVDRLRGAGYGIVEIDAAGVTATADLLDAFAENLGFPSYFGRNLDALEDCMREVATGAYGIDPAATGLVLVLRRFDAFVAHEPRAAHDVLEIVALSARTAILYGRRLLCLVQSDDPALELPPVGAAPIGWNDAESRAADRGL